MSRLIIFRGVIGAGKSTVAREMQSRRQHCAIVEVDLVKVQNPKNKADAMNCVPHEDFPEAGRQAGELLDKGKDVIVTECFADKEHIHWFIESAGRDLSLADVDVFWFMSDLKTVLERKKGQRPARFVKQQHKRHKTRYVIPGEHLIDTSRIISGEIADKVQEILGI